MTEIETHLKNLKEEIVNNLTLVCTCNIFDNPINRLCLEIECNRELNEIEKKIVDDILKTWKFKGCSPKFKFQRDNNYICIHVYSYIHNNLVSEVRTNALNNLI